MNNNILRSKTICSKTKLAMMKLPPVEVTERQQLGKRAALLVSDIIVQHFANISLCQQVVHNTQMRSSHPTGLKLEDIIYYSSNFCSHSSNCTN